MSDEQQNPSDAWRAPQGTGDAEKVQDQVERQAGIQKGPSGGGTLFTEPILVVNQKPKLLELVTEHEVFDQDGNPVGFVAEVGQTTAKKLARFVSSLDQFMTHSYEIRDSGQQPQLVLTRPRKIMKSSFVLSRPDGSEVGRVKQQNVFGKIKFALEAGGQAVGSLNAENWRAWDFNVQDSSGTEVARITKTWGGFAKAVFTQADNYVLEIKEPLQDPLLSLVVATALCVDTALKQDARGLS